MFCKVDFKVEHISIHAPIVGCDRLEPSTQCMIPDFNPRTHRGVRQIKKEALQSIRQFQSTHPSWGATAVTYSIILPVVISIHAPIVGCDITVDLEISFLFLFQSTHPSWGATILSTKYVPAVANFNPRTHRGVRLICRKYRYSTTQISIHAPIVGCDVINFK